MAYYCINIKRHRIVNYFNYSRRYLNTSITVFCRTTLGRILIRGGPMCKWLLFCKNCHERFPQSEIRNWLENYFTSEKPEFPVGGRVLECPNCKATFKYSRKDLKYLDAHTA